MNYNLKRKEQLAGLFGKEAYFQLSDAYLLIGGSTRWPTYKGS